jgi:hypothetical protein
VAQCPEGQAANSTSDNDDFKKNCVACEDNTPFADHTAHKCVAECPVGAVGNAGTGDCDECTDDQFADHEAKECKASADDCPDGSTANDDGNNCDHTCKDEDVGLYFDASEDDNGEAVGCVKTCPEGQTPGDGGAYKVCTDCAEGKYADHEAHECVDECPEGYTANSTSGDCEADGDGDESGDGMLGADGDESGEGFLQQ